MGKMFLDLKVKLFYRLARYTNNRWGYIYWQKAKALYEANTGRPLDYLCPILLSDKLMWLTRYWQHPLKTMCADKYMVRSYVKEKGLEHILIPLLHVYDNVDEIDFDALPNSFVLKCNHASGWNLIVTDKSQIDSTMVRRKFAAYLQTDFSNYFCEIHYKNIPRKIVCEELISHTAPIEYQCWCVNGEPDSLLVCRKNFDGSYDAFSHSCDFKQLYERIEEPENNGILKKPEYLDQLLHYARVLSADFPFVRADFYEVDGQVYFAELTFTPDCNYLSHYNMEFQRRLGAKLILPEKYK